MYGIFKVTRFFKLLFYISFPYGLLNIFGRFIFANNYEFHIVQAALSQTAISQIFAAPGSTKLNFPLSWTAPNQIPPFPDSAKPNSTLLKQIYFQNDLLTP